MGKSDFVRSTNRLCADSRDLIDQSAALVSGSDTACAVHKDQIAKSKEARRQEPRADLAPAIEITLGVLSLRRPRLRGAERIARRGCVSR